MMSEMVGRVARAICARTYSGYCRHVGGDLGCKVGRGAGPEHCIATAEALELGFEGSAARAAIEAMREPAEVMWRAADAKSRGGLATPGETWHAMIDAALR